MLILCPFRNVRVKTPLGGHCFQQTGIHFVREQENNVIGLLKMSTGCVGEELRSLWWNSSGLACTPCSTLASWFFPTPGRAFLPPSSTTDTTWLLGMVRTPYMVTIIPLQLGSTFHHQEKTAMKPAMEQPLACIVPRSNDAFKIIKNLSQELKGNNS